MCVVSKLLVIHLFNRDVLPLFPRLANHSAFPQVIVKYPTHSAPFSSVGVKKVIVTLFFEPGIELLSMFVARRSDRLVKMLCIRLPKVIGGQISASAKPAVYRGFHRGVFIEFKIAVVCMDSRYHRILRVYH